jgi:hypothetical protein
LGWGRKTSIVIRNNVQLSCTIQFSDGKTSKDTRADDDDDFEKQFSFAKALLTSSIRLFFIHQSFTSCASEAIAKHGRDESSVVPAARHYFIGESSIHLKLLRHSSSSATLIVPSSQPLPDHSECKSQQ